MIFGSPLSFPPPLPPPPPSTLVTDTDRFDGSLSRNNKAPNRWRDDRRIDVTRPAGVYQRFNNFQRHPVVRSRSRPLRFHSRIHRLGLKFFFVDLNNGTCLAFGWWRNEDGKLCFGEFVLVEPIFDCKSFVIRKKAATFHFFIWRECVIFTG